MLLQTLDKFALFPELPIELRLKVWTYAFPEPRLVHLDEGKVGATIASEPEENPGTQGSITSQSHTSHSIPVTMWVNKESRRETMSRYILVDRQGLFANYIKKVEQHKRGWCECEERGLPCTSPELVALWRHRNAYPWVLYPNYDAVYVNEQAIFFEESILHKFLTVIEKEKETSIQAIEKLSIREFSWSPFVKRAIKFASRKFRHSTAFWGSPLLRFKGLREMRFVLKQNHLLLDETRDDILQTVEQWIKSHGDDWPGRLPTVTVVSWETLHVA